MSDSNDLRLLFADYVNGEISTEQLQALEAALRTDADLRRAFIEYMNIDSAMGALAALPETEAAEMDDRPIPLITDDPISSNPTTDCWRVAPRVLATVGVIAASLLIIERLWFANPAPDGHALVATVVADVDAALSCDDEPWSDFGLRAGEYRLDQGLLHMQFGGGVMVYVEAPASFGVVSENRVVLRRGRLSANVPPEGIGFTVETPEAEVIDFGTEFSVDVESGASEVHVFEGLVRVLPRSQDGEKTRQPVDLRTSQALQVKESPEEPVEIEVARDRFIRNFDEPHRSYARSVKQFSPLAYYRMPIRDKGLVAAPLQYSGEVLTGDGVRPPHARGVFAGGSLRVMAGSTGRGGRVDVPPSIDTGHFTLAVVVYLEEHAPSGVVATNIQGDKGNFRLALNELGLLEATIRNSNGELRSLTSDNSLPLVTWRHLVITADGDQLRIYEDGRLLVSTPCGMMAPSGSETLWFGTNADATRLWNGRIDEVVLLDGALSDEEIAELYQVALEEIAREP